MNTICKNKIRVERKNMRICNHYKSSLHLGNLPIHLLQSFSWEFNRVKIEVIVLLSIKDIHPVDINWEAKFFKVFVSLYHNVC